MLSKTLNHPYTIAELSRDVAVKNAERQRIEKVKYRNQPAANNAFIGAQFKLDEIIAELTRIRSTMLPCDGWAHAEGFCHDVNDLVEHVNNMGYLTKSHKGGAA